MGLKNDNNKAQVGATPAGGAAVVPGTDKGKKTAANQELIDKGNAILATMDAGERAALGSKSGTLKFVRLLGLASKRQQRRVAEGESRDCSTPVGVTLVSSEPITIPQIDILKNKDTGITPETDITYVDVPAGQEFNLSYYEFMYLIIQPEYAGFCATDADPKGVYFSAKLPTFWKGEAKLPTPTINFKKGSVKASMVDIDEKGQSGAWAIKPDFAEKFGPLMKKAAPKRSAGSKGANPPAPTVVAVALYEMLGLKKAPAAAPEAK